MKSNGLLGIVVLAATFGLLGCKPGQSKPSENTITGQVFIVTKGAENVKLGAVEILLLEKQQVTDLLRERQPDIDAQIKTRQKALDDALGAIETANSNAAAAKLNYDAALARIPTSAEYVRANKQIEALRRKGRVLVQKWHLADRRCDDALASKNPFNFDEAKYQTLLNERNALRKQIDSVNDAIEPLTNQLEQIQRSANDQERPKLVAAQADVTSALSNARSVRVSVSHFPTIGAYMSGFSPVVLKKTLTDADGRFSFSYSRGKAFTLYATAQRQVGQSTEHYSWLVDAPTNSETEQLFLSNGNLTRLDPDRYFELKPQEPERAPEEP
jgi:hypothetical protein